MPQRRPTRRQRAEQIRGYLLDQIAAGASDVAHTARERFGVSRQAINKQLDKLQASDLIVADGATSARRYELRSHEVDRNFESLANVDEHEVWKAVVEPEVSDLPRNVQDICQHGITEMVNNVIDHSESEAMAVKVLQTVATVELRVFDFGVGIFSKIKREMGLETVQEAAFELQKGKYTSDPTRHSGEGIFFTSKMFDKFSIFSGELYFLHRRSEDDWFLESRASTPGTMVVMNIAANSTHTTQEVFDEYSVDNDSLAFDKTKVAIALADTDERLVSRSQAKRVMARLFRFREAMLDFRGVESIGPAFADEVFRVYVSQHPDTHIAYLNANEAVERMIQKAIKSRQENLSDPR